VTGCVGQLLKGEKLDNIGNVPVGQGVTFGNLARIVRKTADIEAI
jgi:hypothetical protein